MWDSIHKTAFIPKYTYTHTHTHILPRVVSASNPPGWLEGGSTGEGPVTVSCTLSPAHAHPRDRSTYEDLGNQAAGAMLNMRAWTWGGRYLEGGGWPAAICSQVGHHLRLHAWEKPEHACIPTPPPSPSPLDTNTTRQHEAPSERRRAMCKAPPITRIHIQQSYVGFYPHIYRVHS